MKRFRMKGMGVLLLVVLAAVSLVGCDLIGGVGGDLEEDPPAQQEERGSLTVSLSDGITARTMEPAISMDVAAFTITGDGPEDETFTPVVIDDPTTTSYEIEGLLAGVWIITVTAENEDGTLIGEGTKTVPITAGDNTVSIDVLPLPGDGEFELTITWPEGTITDPGFDATLTRTGVDTPEPITIPVDTGASQAVYTDTAIVAGYYSLNVLPKTGADVIAGSGFTEAVRIVEGEKTQGLYELTPVGDAEITWNTNLQNPYIIEIERTADTATFTTTVDPTADDYTYEWHLNGVKLDGETASTVTLTDGFVSGTNTLNAIIKKNGIVSSARKIFEAYTISFDEDGGSAVSTQVIIDGMNANEPATPTKEGYSFEGWYEDSGLTTAYDFNAAVTENISLYAKWTELTSYTVTFDVKGGSTVDPQTVYEDDTASEPPAPSKENYAFEGWYTDAELTTEYDFETAVTGDLTLFAKWGVPQGTLRLTFNPTDSSDTTVLEYVLTSGPAYSADAVKSWEEAYGMNITSTEGAPTVAFGIGYYYGTSNQDSGFLASDTPLRVEGFNGSAPVDSSVADYVNFETLIIGTGPDSVEGAFPIDFRLIDTEGTTETVFYGSENGAPTVTFSSTTPEGEYVTGTITGTISMQVSTESSESSVTTKDVYTVDGTFNVLNSVMNDSYTITYDMNNEEPDFMELVFDGNAAMGPWSTPKKDGYKFGGWYTDSELTTPYDMTTVVTTDMNLYAKWDLYAVGDAGPAGGVIFYVDSDDTYPGWAYLEAAPEEITTTDTTSGVWWDDGTTNFNGTDAPLLSDDIGTGLENTQTVIDNSKDVGAAQLCYNYGYDNEGEYFDDWFLPSKDELSELYTYFDGLTDKSSFSPSGYLYWSSSGSSAPNGSGGASGNAWIFPIRGFETMGFTVEPGTALDLFPNTANGTQDSDVTCYARPVRRF